LQTPVTLAHCIKCRFGLIDQRLPRFGVNGNLIQASQRVIATRELD